MAAVAIKQIIDMVGLFFIYRSSLRGLHLFPCGDGKAGGGWGDGWGVKANLIFFARGGLWGFKNKFQQKSKGGGARQFFFL